MKATTDSKERYIIPLARFKRIEVRKEWNDDHWTWRVYPQERLFFMFWCASSLGPSSGMFIRIKGYCSQEAAIEAAETMRDNYLHS